MSTWPHNDLPAAGPLGEHELDAACWRKRQVILTQQQCAAVDDTAGLCGVCGGKCPTPQACERADPLPPAQPPRWVRALLEHPIRWSLLLGGAMFVILWITKP